MTGRPGGGAAVREVAGVVGAYLAFAVCAGWSVRPDGSTRWGVVAAGLIALLMALALLVVPAARGRAVSRD